MNGSMLDFSHITIPESLPIAACEEELINAIRKHPVIIVKGETGSGKTTQLPKLCLKAGIIRREGMIGCTQPRRVAAIAVASRIAEELGPVGPSWVGTKIRFTDRTTRHTRIKVMTDGILLNEMQGDPMLSRYAAIIVDEAHERSLNIDFILGHLIQIRAKRPDLKIIITSATIDTSRFSEAFGGAPVIEVSGRMFPVELRYEPFEERTREGDYTYVDACSDAVISLLQESRQGDILAFLPSERDIREVCDRLSDHWASRCELVPLFGRLSQADQQRIFRPGQKRKVVVATNIAETSITVPGIRYVVDSGLARISRFSAHTRTQRLPIEPISQSSAQQRMGRCGRVADGVCIRLYSEEDYRERPRFTSPEILRSNLASVILRLKAFGFGEIADFPFLDAPEERAIQGGLVLLKELCALDHEGKLTEIGHQLARLPIDPTIGRMLIEAGKSPIRGDVLIIASALAIQDPRERPLDREKEADREHAKFRKNDSDFLTVLQIWKHFDEHYDRWSQGQMRKFCREHFLSYQRLREWREIHDQILRILDDLGESPTNPTTRPTETDEDQIHRCILSGLLGNIAVREEGNQFQATRGRRVMVYPGSVMFRRQERASNPKNAPAAPKRPKEKKEWIVAAELVETSRLFARTICKVDPSWISALATHLINYSHQEPHWSDKAQRVLVWRREFLYGLLVRESRVGYGTIDPEAAKECFIREGIQERSIRDQFPFLTHNQQIEDEVESLQTRLRRAVAYDLTGRIFQFYQDRLPMLSSVAELHPWWRSLKPAERQSMFLQVEDLLDQSVDEAQQQAFPETVDLGGEPGTIEYRYTPGQEEDGATLTVPLSQFLAVQEGSLDWMVPGYVQEKVEQLLKTLPKEFRTHLTPIKDHAEKLMRLIKPSPASLITDLTDAIRLHYHLKIPADSWDLSSLPAHLKLKVRIVDDKSGEVLTQSSDWQQLKTQADGAIASRGLTPGQSIRLKVWKDALARWEKPDVQDWVFDDLPEELVLGEFHGIPLHAYPGLAMTKDGRVHVRLFDRKDEARRLTPTAYRRLCEIGLGRELVWFEKDLRLIKPALLPFADLYAWEAFAQDLQRLVMHSLFLSGLSWPITKTHFRSDLDTAKKQLRTLPIFLRDLLAGIGEQRLALMRSGNASHPAVAATLQRLLPPHFLRLYTITQLQQVPRFLKALTLRVERAAINPIKDSEKAARIDPMLKDYAALCKQLTTRTRDQDDAIRSLFFLLEELRVSVFAQELGTSIKVSEKIIQTRLTELKEQK